MHSVEMYVQVRRACMVEGMSVREASRVFGLNRDTVRKMLVWSVPPGYRCKGPPRRPKLEPFTGVIDAILEADVKVHRKQRHTARFVCGGFVVCGGLIVRAGVYVGINRVPGGPTKPAGASVRRC